MPNDEIIQLQQVAPDAVIALNLELKAGKRPRSMALYRDFESLLARFNEDVKLPLAAFSDETVLEEEFQGREEWEGHSLCSNLLNDGDTGRTFYARLHDMLERGAEPSLVEVYHLCLLCGFKGRHYRNEAERQRVIARTSALLQAAGRLPSSSLPEPLGTIEATAAQRQSRLDWYRWSQINKWWLLGLILAIVTLRLFLFFLYVGPEASSLVR